MTGFDLLLTTLNAILWHNSVLLILLGTGVVFTVWSGFSQYRSLTHGVQVLRGGYDDPDDPGAISHFQALSAALSATVGLGNIGGVALAISLGGPGAVFWMWIVGFFGMAVKLTEVTLSMLYRNTDDPDNPHGGPMWVVSKGLARMNPALAPVGKFVGSVFCVTLLVSTITGGNMFQAWNVGEITEEYFGIPSIATGIVLAILVAMVIIGGIKRIGAVAGRLVPLMVALYLLAGAYVLIMSADQIPSMLALIFRSAFSPQEFSGAFLGGTVGYAFLFGMKRALFSNEAGQGSSPIAHSAAKTDEPVREALVAGLEPFIDTLIVCTFTALVILSTGIWNRAAEANYAALPAVVSVGATEWTLETLPVPQRVEGQWASGDAVLIVLSAGPNPQTGNNLHHLDGVVVDQSGDLVIEWASLISNARPQVDSPGIYASYVGATLTAKAFDSVTPGLGKWLVTLAVWLFAFSTMISWSYYGEQGVIYLAGRYLVLPYKVLFLLLVIVGAVAINETSDMEKLMDLGTGAMLWANMPIVLLMGFIAVRELDSYFKRLKAGEFSRLD